MGHTELDYLMIADFIKEEEILERHWNRCAQEKTWVSLDGTKVAFEDLGTKHLISIIKMLIKFNTKRCENLLVALVDEVSFRLTNKEGE